MKKIECYLQKIWYKHKKLTSFDSFVFCVLYALSFFYRICFFIVLRLKSRFGHRCIGSPSKVVSVGNLSVGGTGKTVFVQFLLTILCSKSCAVVLRGYGGKSSKKKALMVSDGDILFQKVDVAGDEAFMLAQAHKIPVVVCPDRRKSIALLKEYKNFLDVIILDDAYQNFHVQKDLEILLLDARYPLSNSYALPAGFLRERDCSRADVIILTHARSVTRKQLMSFKKELPSSAPIFEGSSNVQGVFYCNNGLDCTNDLKKKKIILFAGIGNISGFISSAESLDFNIVHVVDFGDHYAYSLPDIKNIMSLMRKHNADAVVTTYKDWVKISDLGSLVPSCYVLRIGFEFLSLEQYNKFTAVVDKKLG